VDWFLTTYVSSTPAVCQDSFKLCTMMPTHAKTFLDHGDFCGFLFDKDAKLCLVNGGSCTEDDLQHVQDAVCPKSTQQPAATTSSPGATPLYGLARTADANITASPTNIHNGFTKYLTINCTFLAGPGSDFHSIMSLILSKTSSPNDSDYQELATVTVYSNDLVDVIDNLGADVTGHLAALSESFITYKWKYPDSGAEGNYKCVGFGMDMKGHPRVSEAVATVSDKAVDLDMLLDKMSNMDKEIDEVMKYRPQISSRFNKSAMALVEASDMYNGKPYFLSRPVTRNVWMEDSLCRMYGGRLVEVDDKAEDAFVMGLASMGKPAGHPVLLGATDAKTEGTWMFLKSGAPATYLDWQRGHSNAGTTKNCLYLGVPEVATTKAPMSTTTTTTAAATTTTTTAKSQKRTTAKARRVTKAAAHHSRAKRAAVPSSMAMYDDTCYELSFDRFVCES